MADHVVSLRFATDSRRWLQLALAAIWVLDGLLQYQTYMFTKAFSVDVLKNAALGNPPWIAGSIMWAAGVVHQYPLATNAVFATLQLALGLGIAFRRTLKPALAASIGWSLLVWWFGEGLGGLLTGQANPLSGAPGGVLLYVLLAVVLWPTDRSTVGTYVASRPVGPVAATVIWIALWGGLATLALQPANLTRQGIRELVTAMTGGQPRWLVSVMTGFANLSSQHGAAFTVIGAVILALIGIGILLPKPGPRISVIASLVAAGFIWAIGEALGGVVGGRSTDVGSGLLLALIALAYWPGNIGSARSLTPDPDAMSQRSVTLHQDEVAK